MRKYRRNIFIVMIFGALFVHCSNAADVNDIDTEIQAQQELIRKLKDEIAQIDSEMNRCERASKGWKAATVIGGIGVAATGTAAIVQAVKLNKQKNVNSQNTEGEHK